MSEKDLSVTNPSIRTTLRKSRKGSNASIMVKYQEEARMESVSVDDASEAHNRSFVMRQAKAGPSPRLIGTLMIWLKNINRLRAISTSKAFYKWKYKAQLATYQLATLPLEITEERAMLIEQKNSYLKLFAENEKLREQVAEQRRVHSTADKALRSTSLRLLLSTFLRKRLTTKLRAAYDIWFHNVRMLRLVAETSQRASELAVGLQQVESERHYVRQTEAANAQLRVFLSMAIYFFKWKSKIASSMLAEERCLHDQQRRVIFEELRRMREAVSFANDEEHGLLQGAMRRGAEAERHLNALRERVTSIVAASRAHKPPALPDLNDLFPKRERVSSAESVVSRASVDMGTAGTAGARRASEKTRTVRRQQQQSIAGGAGGAGQGTPPPGGSSSSIVTSSPPPPPPP